MFQLTIDPYLDLSSFTMKVFLKLALYQIKDTFGGKKTVLLQHTDVLGLM